MAGRRDGLWGADGVSSSSGARASLFGSASLAQRGGQQQQALLEERDIEAELDGVADRVARLRRVVGAIDEEAKAHSCLVEDLEDVMRKAQAALKETLRKMNRTYASGGGGCAGRDAARACFNRHARRRRVHGPSVASPKLAPYL